MNLKEAMKKLLEGKATRLEAPTREGTAVLIYNSENFIFLHEAKDRIFRRVGDAELITDVVETVAPMFGVQKFEERR